MDMTPHDSPPLDSLSGEGAAHGPDTALEPLDVETAFPLVRMGVRLPRR